MTADRDETYNGWSNRETWAINLHLSNNEGDYEAAMDAARGCIANAEEEERTPVGLMADWIKDWTENVFDMVTGSSSEYGRERPGEEARMFVSDVGSWWRADFYEIAEHWIDDAREVES